MKNKDMTQEDKELLLRDLCARLHYGVKIYLEDFPNATFVGIVNEGIILHCDKYDHVYDTPWNIEYVKPYLFPLSSMTEEQRGEFDKVIGTTLKDLESNEQFSCMGTIAEINFYHKYHFDYRGLIPMGLAIDCTNLNIY